MLLINYVPPIAEQPSYDAGGLNEDSSPARGERPSCDVSGKQLELDGDVSPAIGEQPDGTNQVTVDFMWPARGLVVAYYWPVNAMYRSLSVDLIFGRVRRTPASYTAQPSPDAGAQPSPDAGALPGRANGSCSRIVFFAYALSFARHH